MYILPHTLPPPVPVRPHVPYAHNDTRRPGRFWRRSRLAKRMMNNSALGETRIGPLRTSYPRLISQYETCPCGSISGATEAKPARTVFFQPVQWTQQTQPNVTERRFIHSRRSPMRKSIQASAPLADVREVACQCRPYHGR